MCPSPKWSAWMESLFAKSPSYIAPVLASETVIEHPDFEKWMTRLLEKNPRAAVSELLWRPQVRNNRERWRAWLLIALKANPSGVARYVLSDESIFDEKDYVSLVEATLTDPLETIKSVLSRKDVMRKFPKDWEKWVENQLEKKSYLDRRICSLQFIYQVPWTVGGLDKGHIKKGSPLPHVKRSFDENANDLFK